MHGFCLQVRYYVVAQYHPIVQLAAQLCTTLSRVSSLAKPSYGARTLASSAPLLPRRPSPTADALARLRNSTRWVQQAGARPMLRWGKSSGIWHIALPRVAS